MSGRSKRSADRRPRDNAPAAAPSAGGADGPHLKGLRTAAAGAFVILLVYTGFTAHNLTSQQLQTPAAETADQAAQATRRQVAAEAAAALYAVRPSEPLDAAELAVRLARPHAAAAVLQGDEVLAASGLGKGRGDGEVKTVNWPQLAETATAGSDVAVVRTGRAGVRIVVTTTPAAAPAPSPSSRALTEADLMLLLTPLGLGGGALLVFLMVAERGERRRAEVEARERRFRLAVEAARCGIWEWDLREDRVILSDTTAVMLGWGGAGEASGDEVLERIAPEHRGRVRQALNAARSFGAFDVSFAVPGTQGEFAWIDARGQSASPPDARGYASLIGVAVDVTPERSAQLRAQSAESRMQDAIESVSEAFVLWDRFGRLILCNTAYRDFFKLEPRILKPGASRKEIQKIVELAIRSQTATSERYGLREAELNDGRWVQINERRTADGGLVMTAADITPLKLEAAARREKELALRDAVERLKARESDLSDLAEKYRDAKIRAESANRAKSGFLANMSHELRTPLNAIIGFSEIMMTQMFGGMGDKRYVEYSHDIHASGQHLLQLINDVLDMSKIEAGKLTLHVERVDLSEMIADSVRLMRNRAETSKLTLAVDAPADLPLVAADQRAVKQILLNLLSNAVKFTPVGGRIEVRAAVEGTQMHVRVSDSGIGIAAEDLSRLGRPFEQVETQHAKTSHGTGLGLALTKSLVAMQKGRFALESASGVGTTASFTLPLASAGQDAASNPTRGVAAA